MKNKEIKLNKEHFKIFNEDDQFQLFCDDEGFPIYEDFNLEVDKLYEKYDYICITKDDCVIGVKDGKRKIINEQAFEGYEIAKEIIENE